MATYKATLYHWKKTDGTKRIVIRITKHRQSEYVHTEIYLEPQFFDTAKGIVKKNYELQTVYNELIRKHITNLRKVEADLELRDLPSFAKDIKTEYEEKNSTDLLSFYKKHIQFVKEHSKKRTGERHDYHLVKFEKFINKKYQGISIQKTTTEVIYDFQKWLLAIPNKQSTANKDIEVLAKVMKKAVKKGYIPESKNPFNDFKYTSPEDPVKDDLTEEEILKLYNLKIWPIPNNNKKQADHRLHYKNAFLTAYLASGMRMGDTLCLRVSNIVDGRLNYTMQKTGLFRSIPITGMLKEILESYTEGKQPNEYIFPLLDDNSPTDIEMQLKYFGSKINYFLRQAMFRLRIKKHVTAHTAKHSFSNQAIEKTEDLVKTQIALGHTEINTTMKYINKNKLTRSDDLIIKTTNIKQDNN